MATRKQKVLFLCTQNSARSQRAEAFLRERGGDRFEVYSAGCEVGAEIHPYAVEVMDEVGIDISDQYSKGPRTYMGKIGFTYSIIVYARAERNCPKTFPGVGTPGSSGSSMTREERTSQRARGWRSSGMCGTRSSRRSSTGWSTRGGAGEAQGVPSAGAYSPHRGVTARSRGPQLDRRARIERGSPPERSWLA